MTRTRLEQPLAERLRALRDIRDAMLADANRQPEEEQAGRRAYAYAIYQIRVQVEKWLERNADTLSPVALGSSLMGAAMQVVQTALLVSTNDKFTRGEIFGRFIDHNARRMIEEGLILSPQEMRAQVAEKVDRAFKDNRDGMLLGPDGRPVRVQ